MSKQLSFGQKIIYVACFLCIVLSCAAIIFACIFLKRYLAFRDFEVIAFLNSPSMLLAIIPIVFWLAVFTGMVKQKYGSGIPLFERSKRKKQFAKNPAAQKNKRVIRILILLSLVSSLCLLVFPLVPRTTLDGEGNISRISVLNQEKESFPVAQYSSVEVSIQEYPTSVFSVRKMVLSVYTTVNTGKTFRFDAGDFRDTASLIQYLTLIQSQNDLTVSIRNVQNLDVWLQEQSLTQEEQYKFRQLF